MSGMGERGLGGSPLQVGRALKDIVFGMPSWGKREQIGVIDLHSDATFLSLMNYFSLFYVFFFCKASTCFITLPTCTCDHGPVPKYGIRVRVQTISALYSERVYLAYGYSIC